MKGVGYVTRRKGSDMNVHNGNSGDRQSLTLGSSASSVAREPTTSSGTTAPESLLVRYVKAHVKQGEKAQERADQARDKAEQHFIAAGTYLKTLKITYAPTWQQWETVLKVKVKLSTGRASELMQLADGRKSLQEVRDATAARVRALRGRSVFVTSECNEEEAPAPSIATPTPSAAALDLIDALAQSDITTRRAAAEALTSGARQTEFEAVVEAVCDLYQRLSKAGR